MGESTDQPINEENTEKETEKKSVSEPADRAISKENTEKEKEKSE